MRTKLREMVPADVPILLEQLRQQNERDGTSYGMPQVFDENGRKLSRIPLALTAVDVETNAPVQGHIWETTLEHMTFGTRPEATLCSIREQAAVWYLLRQKGFRDEHLLVPVSSAPKMEKNLAEMLGMIDTGKLMKHFYRLLDPAENAELQDWYRQQEGSKGPHFEAGDFHDETDTEA